LSNAEKEKIAQLAAKYQCYVIEDDIYAECSFMPNALYRLNIGINRVM
jgi:DNA-binding transcriptional MocR family regulator